MKSKMLTVSCHFEQVCNQLSTGILCLSQYNVVQRWQRSQIIEDTVGPSWLSEKLISKHLYK